MVMWGRSMTYLDMTTVTMNEAAVIPFMNGGDASK